jgi:predicted TPR repeat methyltransferase
VSATEKAKDYVSARKYYQDAIELAPEFADPWFGLGIIEMNSGNVLTVLFSSEKL